MSKRIEPLVTYKYQKELNQLNQTIVDIKKALMSENVIDLELNKQLAWVQVKVNKELKKYQEKLTS